MAVFQRKPDSEEGADAEAEDGGGLLGSLKKRGGGLMDRVAGSVMDAARSSLLKQAMEARDRGNLGAAFHLAKEEYDNLPDEPGVAGFYWDVAVAYERPAEAIQAVAGLIRKNVIGAHELATQYWVELDSLVPGSVLDPSTLARLVPHLAEQVSEDAQVEEPERGDDDQVDPEQEAAREVRSARRSALRSALRGIVDERNRDSLTAGLAMHVAELARELDPESALAAARHALECEDLHDTKRDRMRTLIADLDPDAPLPPEPAPQTEPEQPAQAGPTSDSLRDESNSEEEGEVHPAQNHPLRTDSPPHEGLSDDEVEAMQRRLPPTRPGSAAVESTGSETEPPADVAAEPVITSEAPLEPALAPLGEPESLADDSCTDLEPDADGHLDVDILTDSAPELEIDDLDTSQPHLEVDVDVLAQSFPELEIEALPDAPAAVLEQASEQESEVVTESRSETPTEAPTEPPIEVEAEPEVTDAEPEPDIEIGEPEPEPVAATDESSSRPAAPPGADVSETDDLLSALDPQPEPIADPDTPIPAEIPIDTSVEAPLYPDLKRMPARPTGLEDESLLIEVAGERKARIDLTLVQAIAVGEVSGLGDEPVVIIDLLMDVGDNGGAPRRLVRLRSDEFDPLELSPDESDAGDALRSLLAILMERTRAIPLPDPDAALGLMVPSFDSLDVYEQQVLQVQR